MLSLFVIELFTKKFFEYSDHYSSKLEFRTSSIDLEKIEFDSSLDIFSSSLTFPNFQIFNYLACKPIRNFSVPLNHVCENGSASLEASKAVLEGVYIIKEPIERIPTFYLCSHAIIFSHMKSFRSH